MRQSAIDVYKFSELSETAQDCAKQWHASGEWCWESEALASIKALAAHFGGRMSGWSIDYANCSYSSAQFDFDEPQPGYAEIKRGLLALGEFNPETLKGLGDCKLTGYCMDESAIDGFRLAFHAGERDLGELMEAAFRSWLKDCQADYASQYENAEFADHCEANEYEFTANGEIWGGA